MTYLLGQENYYLLNTCSLYHPARTLWSPKAPYLIPSSGCHTYPHSLLVSEPLMHVGSLTLSSPWVALHMYVIKFGLFLLLICLMPIWLLHKPKEPWGQSFLLPHHENQNKCKLASARAVWQSVKPHGSVCGNFWLWTGQAFSEVSSSIRALGRAWPYWC